MFSSNWDPEQWRNVGCWRPGSERWLHKPKPSSPTELQRSEPAMSEAKRGEGERDLKSPREEGRPEGCGILFAKVEAAARASCLSQPKGGAHKGLPLPATRRCRYPSPEGLVSVNEGACRGGCLVAPPHTLSKICARDHNPPGPPHTTPLTQRHIASAITPFHYGGCFCWSRHAMRYRTLHMEAQVHVGLSPRASTVNPPGAL